MCMQVMNLYSYTIIDTCSCKKKKKEFCSKKCACVCPDFKSPPCVWSQACAGISARLGTFMLPLTRAVCVCFVQHLTDRRQKCVGPSGSFTSLTQWPSGPTKRHQSAEGILMPSPHTHSSLYPQDLQYEEYGGKKFCLTQFINVLHADRTSRTRCVEYQKLDVLLDRLYI